MGERDRNERGQYESEHAVEEYVEAVRKHEPAATSEVADEVGVTRQGADYRLRQLEEKGLVRKKKIGPALVWMVDAD